MPEEPEAAKINFNTDEVARSTGDPIAGHEIGDANLLTATTANSGEMACQQPIDSEYVHPRLQRDRRTAKSPMAIAALLETFAAPPLSPASSSCTSLGNSSADATFEPSVDMMVNDFDDEQTLNEEEAMAAMEHQDPHDEIATLREESEMPLEELLAKYQVAPPAMPFYDGASKQKKSKKKKKKRSTDEGEVGKPAKHRKIERELSSGVNNTEEIPVTTSQLVDDGEERLQIDEQQNKVEINEEQHTRSKRLSTSNLCHDSDESLDDELEDCGDVAADGVVVNHKDLPNIEHVEKTKPRRTHLMDLYPEESFTEVLALGTRMEADPQLEHLCNNEGDDDVVEDANVVGEEEDEEDFDGDYVKKTIMVGPSYQATIPDGLSQYGDVLPYENEDKLIWEPSQVSEREVEEYLLKARDIKPSLLDNIDDEVGDEPNATDNAADTALDSALVTSNGSQGDNKESNAKSTDTDAQNTGRATAAAIENSVDGSTVVKDNEQALHLLVQCGYDFKEALRRKRLNALPLTGSMSLWSEEECHKFEEGIQKFGKDFLKIRQNQVRTRTMRELVQFYYIWKKSDRRDHNFANSDTVDHMDIYLNEGSDYNPTMANNTPTTTGSSITSNGTTAVLGVRKNNAGIQKNSISIMMSGNITTTSSSISPATATTTPTPPPTDLPLTTSPTTASTQLNTNSTKSAATNRKRSGISGVLVGNASSYDNSTLNQAITQQAATVAQMK